MHINRILLLSAFFLFTVIGVYSLSREDFQNDPGVLAAVKFLLKNAHREGFFENLDNLANLERPQRIRGTRIDIPGFIYKLKFQVRDGGNNGKLLECMGEVWDEHRTRNFANLQSVNCFRLD